jgi:hypothetical protein
MGSAAAGVHPAGAGAWIGGLLQRRPGYGTEVKVTAGMLVRANTRLQVDPLSRQS